MLLHELAVKDWRNAEQVELDLDSPLVVLWGPNGAGKTNLLEAIGVLATLKSFRATAWEQVLRWGTSSCSVRGRSSSQLGSAQLQVRVQPAESRNLQRLAFMDGTPVREPGRYFDNLRAVTFVPDDVQVVRGSPENRRRFLDRAAFNAWPQHLENARLFRRALLQKGALLKSGRARLDELDAWDERLAHAGVQLVLGRLKLVQALREPLQRIHEQLAAGASASFEYRSVLLEGSEDSADPGRMRQRYLERLAAVRSEELLRRSHLVGPQRDDVIFFLGSQQGAARAARRYGSQGQVRTLALALKLAELAVAGSSGDPPVLLVDDLSSELDRHRLARLVALIEDLDSQVVVTTTDPGPIMACSERGGRAVEIRSGTVASVVSGG